MRTMHKNGHRPHHNANRHGAGMLQDRSLFPGLAKEAVGIKEELLDQAKKRGGELLDSAQEKGQKSWKRTERWIKKNPASAIGAAFAIGIILKSLFTKSGE